MFKWSDVSVYKTTAADLPCGEPLIELPHPIGPVMLCLVSAIYNGTINHLLVLATPLPQRIDPLALDELLGTAEGALARAAKLLAKYEKCLAERDFIDRGDDTRVAELPDDGRD